jgi:hypothetical protein
MVWGRKKPLTRPATAGESAVAGHPLPKGEGYMFELGTPRVQPKMWDMLSPKGEGYDSGMRGLYFRLALPFPNATEHSQPFRV